MKLSFAALHQLLRPSLTTTGELPPPQRTALRLAFGLEDGAPPDGFLVGLAALGLLAGRAEARPLLCLVDDAHWLDHESAAALAFLARRLYADSIVMVFAVREPAPGSVLLDGLPELRLAGLDERAAPSCWPPRPARSWTGPGWTRRSASASWPRPGATRWP